ncbi:hypothetical protein I6G56_00705 (plasmid) [Burkholderia humptydooensis]|uniref:Uncharacterized protein n=2 Tax=Burkholderia humptydooensis TaxID=430531 RepID=A0A7U4P7R9_9BURK|nr:MULTISPECIES: hypothetical protein [Burkholderia]AJY38282.1 hypothetical protein BW21_6183 [Burkholderia sp. 2002721687]ALX44553.1 hypothetical protein AQ610_18550 [Burkholderia humptydooensis]EIP85026.1 hypothetical protein A33K_18298 [Burkholderia humptydooensis MSMB43]QPS42064.1 hypothetical protein I6G56_00705 [Burkholderia humptydooensis]
MSDRTQALAFEQLHEFTAPAAPAAPGGDIEAWTNGARFALAAVARATLDPLTVALEACAAEQARCVAAQQLESPPERDTLPDTVRAAIRTIDLQLDLIAARAPGKRVDKAPVVRTLTHLKARLERAVSATPGPATEVRDDH